MDVLITMTIVNSVLATYFFSFCLKIIDKKNKKKTHTFLTVIFAISYFILFYIVQSSLPSEIKNWYIIDSIITGFSGLGFLVMLYSVYKKLKDIFPLRRT